MVLSGTLVARVPSRGSQTFDVFFSISPPSFFFLAPLPRTFLWPTDWAFVFRAPDLLRSVPPFFSGTPFEKVLVLFFLSTTSDEGSANLESFPSRGKEQLVLVAV